MRRSIFAFVSLLLAFGSPAAGQEALPARIVGNANAPVELQRCRPNSPFAADYNIFLNVHNRTQHDLLSFDIQFKVYDSESTLIGQTAFTDTPGKPLASDDTQLEQNTSYFQTSEPASAISYMTCKIVAATFTGRRAWRLGQTWPEKLLPKGSSEDTSSAPSSSTVSRSDDTAAPAKLATSVLSAWNDVDPVSHVGTLVHERIRVDNLRPEPVSAYPGHFVLTVALAGGKHSTYFGIKRPAPMYPKYDFVSKLTTYVPEVAPDEDLGKLGSIAVPSNGSATTTVTFYVPEELAAPSDNRNVAYR